VQASLGLPLITVAMENGWQVGGMWLENARSGWHELPRNAMRLRNSRLAPLWGWVFKGSGLIKKPKEDFLT